MTSIDYAERLHADTVARLSAAFWPGTAYVAAVIDTAVAEATEELRNELAVTKQSLKEIVGVVIDDPQWDCTDAAHPAFCRGNDAGEVRVIRKALDGSYNGSGVLSGAELEQLRRDVMAMKINVKFCPVKFCPSCGAISNNMNYKNLYYCGFCRESFLPLVIP